MMNDRVVGVYCSRCLIYQFVFADGLEGIYLLHQQCPGSRDEADIDLRMS